MRLIDADTAAAFAENCGATFVAKKLRDSTAFPEVVTRCKDCKYYKPDEYECGCDFAGGLPYVKADDFCSYGEPKEGTHAGDHD